MSDNKLNFDVGFDVTDGAGDLQTLVNQLKSLSDSVTKVAEAYNKVEGSQVKMNSGMKTVSSSSQSATKSQEDFAKVIKDAWDSGGISASQAMELLKSKMEEYEKSIKQAKKLSGEAWTQNESIQEAQSKLADLKNTYSQIEKVALSSSDSIKKYSTSTYKEMTEYDKQQMQERLRAYKQETYEKQQELDKQETATKGTIDTIKSAWANGNASAKETISGLNTVMDTLTERLNKMKTELGDEWVNDKTAQNLKRQIDSVNSEILKVETTVKTTQDNITKYTQETGTENKNIVNGVEESIVNLTKTQMQERVQTLKQETLERKAELKKQEDLVKSAIDAINSSWKNGDVSASKTIERIKTLINELLLKVDAMKEELGEGWFDNAQVQGIAKNISKLESMLKSVEGTVKDSQNKIKSYNQETEDDITNLTKSELEARVQYAKEALQDQKTAMKNYKDYQELIIQDIESSTKATADETGAYVKAGIVSLETNFRLFAAQAFGVYALVNAFQELGRNIVDVNYNVINNQRLMGDFSDSLREELNDSAANIAKQTGILMSDAQEIQGAWIRINEKYAESAELLNKISLATAKFMNVGEIEDADEAVKLVNASMLQFGMTVDEGIETLNKWAYMADVTAMGTADEFGESISKFGGQLAASNGNMDDAIVLTSLLGDKLAKTGSEAGNSLKTLTTYLYREKTRNLFDDLAESTGDASISIMETDTKFKDFRTTLGIMSTQYNKAIAEGNDLLAYQIRSCLGATRQADASIAILKAYSSDASEYYDKLYELEQESTSYLDEQNEALMSTFKNQWNVLYTTITEFGTNIANSGILDSVTAIMSVLNSFISTLSNLHKGTLTVIVRLSELAIAFFALKKITQITGIMDKFNESIKKGSKASIEEAEKLRSSQSAYFEKAAMMERMNKLSDEQIIAINDLKIAQTQFDYMYKNGIITANQYRAATEELKNSFIELESVQKSETSQTLINTAAQKAGIAAVGAEATAQAGTLKNSFQNIISDMGNLATTMSENIAASIKGIITNPIAIATVAITAIVSAWQKAAAATEEQAQKVDEISSKLESYQSEYDELIQKRDSGTITKAEETRLGYVEKQLAIEQKIYDIQKKILVHDETFGGNLIDGMDSLMSTSDKLSSSLVTQMKSLQSNESQLYSMQKAYDDVNAKIETGTAVSGNMYNSLENEREKYSSSLLTLQSTHETTFNSFVSDYQELESETSILQYNLDEGFYSGQDKIDVENRIKDNKATLESLRNLADGNEELTDAMDTTTEAAEDQDDAFDTLKSTLSEYQSKIDTLTDAQEAMNEAGFLTAEQAAKFLEQGDEYKFYLDETADGYVLNAAGVQALTDANSELHTSISDTIAHRNDDVSSQEAQREANAESAQSAEDEAKAREEAEKVKQDAMVNTAQTKEDTDKRIQASNSNTQTSNNETSQNTETTTGNQVTSYDHLGMCSKTTTDNVAFNNANSKNNTLTHVAGQIEGYGTLESKSNSTTGNVEQNNAEMGNDTSSTKTDVETKYVGMYSASSTAKTNITGNNSDIESDTEDTKTTVETKYGGMYSTSTTTTTELSTQNAEIQTKVDDLKTSVKDAYADIFNGLADDVGSGFDAVQKVVDEKAPNITTTVTGEIEKCDTAITNFFNSLPQKFTDALQTAETNTPGIFSTFTDELENELKTADSIASTEMDNIATTITNKKTSIRDAFTTIWDGLDVNAQSVFDKIKSNFGTTFTEIYNTIWKVHDNIGQAINSIWEGIKSKTTLSLDKLNEIVKSGMDSCYKSVTDVADKMYGQGSKMMNDLKSGIEDSDDGVFNAMDTAADELLKRFKKKLGINSPSTEMYSIGSYLIQGLVEGMNDEDFESFSDNMVQSIIDAFKGGSVDILQFFTQFGSKAVSLMKEWGVSFGTSITTGNWFSPIGRSIDWSAIGWDEDFGDRTGSVGTQYHEGIDLNGSNGVGYGSPVYSIGTGTVVYAGENGGYGNQIQVDYGNGLKAWYSHLSAIGVSVGDTVTGGQAIGAVGNTGDSYGAHLDFRTSVNGTFVDPELILNSGSSSGTTSGSLSNWINAAIAITGIDASNASALYTMAMAESGGNPSAVNLWDSNAAAGTPSIGIMQVIQPTFDAYKLAGFDDIYDPVSNIIASIRYQMSRYGHIVGHAGYAVGSRYIPYDQITTVHEGEAIFPASQNPYTNSGGDMLAEVYSSVGEDVLNAVAKSSSADSNDTEKYPEGSETSYSIDESKLSKYVKSEESALKDLNSKYKSLTDDEKSKEDSSVESNTKSFISNVESLFSKITSALKDKYSELHDDRIKQLEKERDAQLEVHNTRIDELNAEIEKLQGDTVEDKEANLATLKDSFEKWKLDDSTLGKAKQKEYYDQITDLEKEIQIQKLQNQIDEEEAINDAINEAYENATDSESTSYDSVLAELDQKMSDKYLADEASSLITNNKLDEITQLLSEFSADYKSISYIMGESIGTIISNDVAESLANYKDVLYKTISSLGGVNTNASASAGVSEKITTFATGGSVGDNEGLAYIDLKERVLSAQQTQAFDKLVYDILPSIDSNTIGSTFGEVAVTNNNGSTFNKEFMRININKVENHSDKDVKEISDSLCDLVKGGLRKSGVNIRP